MFKCFPIQSKEEQREICARLGAEFRIDDLAYRVWIDEEEAGVITFCIKGKKGCLRQICFRKEKEDFEVMFICGRACMNFMDSVGATEGYFLCRKSGAVGSGFGLPEAAGRQLLSQYRGIFYRAL